jgi:hypothetical protein
LRQPTLISSTAPLASLPTPIRLARSLLLLAVILGIAAATLLVSPAAASAAEVLRVRGGGLLQVGDRNRSYDVQLGCMSIDPEHEAEADAWLRRELPRRTRVNLRPVGQYGGLLLARINRLEDGVDVSDALIDAGLASAFGCP